MACFARMSWPIERVLLRTSRDREQHSTIQGTSPTLANGLPFLRESGIAYQSPEGDECYQTQIHLTRARRKG
jgi:hypothetical protein